MQFDQYFYTALGENKDKELLTNEGYVEFLWTIRKTSSSQAHADIPGNKLEDPGLDYLRELKKNEIYKFNLDEDGDQNYIHVGWQERGLVNKVLSCIYRLFRCIYVSIWYYFLPLVALFGSFYVPYFIQMQVDEKESQASILTTTEL